MKEETTDPAKLIEGLLEHMEDWVYCDNPRPSNVCRVGCRTFGTRGEEEDYLAHAPDCALGKLLADARAFVERARREG